MRASASSCGRSSNTEKWDVLSVEVTTSRGVFTQLLQLVRQILKSSMFDHILEVLHMLISKPFYHRCVMAGTVGITHPCPCTRCHVKKSELSDYMETFDDRRDEDNMELVKRVTDPASSHLKRRAAQEELNDTGVRAIVVRFCNSLTLEAHV